MDHLIFLFGTHFIGDFPFQSDWMVRFKATDCVVTVDGTVTRVIARWQEVLAYHVGTYVFANVVFSSLMGYHPTPQGVAADAITHFAIDTAKCRGIIKPIWLDQLCHLTVRTTLWSLGWL